MRTIPPIWPCSGTDLARRLGYNERDIPGFKYATERVVRPALIALGCPKSGSHARAYFVVSEDMARRVAVRVGRSLSA
jgi:hypothetical protein